MNIPFEILFLLACIGFSVCVIGIVTAIVALCRKGLTVKRNRHWKKQAYKASLWLGQWGA